MKSRPTLCVLFYLSCIFSFTACQPEIIDISLGESITLGYGESAYVPEEDLTVTFRDVLQDSRCPAHAECVDQGEVRIQLSMKEADLQEEWIEVVFENTPDVNVSAGLPTPSGIEVLILSVSPERRDNRQQTEGSYEIELLLR